MKTVTFNDDIWRLVPKDPAEALAMGFAYLDAARLDDPLKLWAFSHAGYRAMLAAAPSSPVTGNPATGWISVDERLPNRYVEVIVWPNPTVYCMTAILGRDGWAYGEYIPHFGCKVINCGNVTHWQPLPLPPSPDETKS
ncbi:DUF551 domain-containing protein [Glaciimonas sp. PCH181]|uniref:DUF551 domain-containing protein n=1 Tax=Glaciimonas sp. PCH181 TaxID=2133943 RepID=UPI000D3AFA6B|nr:DUF551 domain-containing protein [Glaciimonas sp. PCH181]PUA19627.1 hypothetical protein C7W93_07215 [Glaciimonas sp. PCH181]